MFSSLPRWGAAATLFLTVAGAAHAQAYVNATVGGELAPGVYGRVQIGNAPPPPVLYPQPVVVRPPAVVLPRSPIYLYVPPGHAAHWGKHCVRYNACSQPVYFVQEPPRRHYDRGPGKRHDARHDRRPDPVPGKGRGHGPKHRD